MERWQIIVACLAFIAIWMMYKRWRDGGGYKKTGAGKRQRSVEEEVDSWYQDAQEHMAMMEEDDKAVRIDSWDKMGRQEQLAYGRRFLSLRFGPVSPGKYDAEETIRVGLAAFVIGAMEKEEQPE